MVMATAGAALAGGLTPDRLENAGWTCLGEGEVHCIQDIDCVFAPKYPTFNS